MKTKQKIVQNWLPRYTGIPLDKFGKYILLTNFIEYIKLLYKINLISVSEPQEASEM